MNEKSVSFIMPVYNTPLDFFSKSLDSLGLLAFKDLEFLIINDGSTKIDVSKIKKKYENDERFLFIDKENTGVSNTRNLGIELSKGKYLFFIDSDDELNTEEFIDIYKFVVESNFDLICFNSKTIINSKISKNFIFKKSSILGGGVVWAKFFKREFILKNNLRFNPNLKYSEDSVFMSDFNKFFPKSINFEDLCIYYYRISNDHTMTRYNINAFDDFNKTFIELKKICQLMN